MCRRKDYGKDGAALRGQGQEGVTRRTIRESVIVDYKDDATAFNGLKKGTIAGKGVINNRMTNLLMQMLEKNGMPTHFVEELSDRETLVKKVTIVPLEVIIRNIAAGSLRQAPAACRRASVLDAHGARVLL